MKKAPWKPHDTLAAAKLASLAGRRHLNSLSTRGLDAAFFDGLDADVQQFQTLTTGQATQTEQLRGKTRKLSEVLAEANRRIVGMRQAISLTYPPRHWTRAEFGLGVPLNAKSVPSTLAALQALRHGMQTHPAEASGAGLTAADATAVQGYLDEIPRADATQESSKDLRKAATAIKEALHLSIYGKMNRLRIAAGLALAEDPAALAEIINPYPNSPKKKTPTPKP